MKTTNKCKIMVASMLIGATAQSALANTSAINCVASDHQSFGFRLDSEPVNYQSAVYSGSATDLHGMNVAIRGLPVKILVNPILTRTIVGFNYSFRLPSGTLVALTNITYASASFENKLGIKGHAKLPNGGVVSLVCQ
jgi:hypothetical protein